jgi:threonine synthase
VCARAGIRYDVCVPASTSPAKLLQARAYGANVISVPVHRQRAADAAVEARVLVALTGHGLKTLREEAP